MRMENRRLCARRKDHGFPRRNRTVCSDIDVVCFPTGSGVTQGTVLGGVYGINGWMDG
jgi:hypothetical protein